MKSFLAVLAVTTALSAVTPAIAGEVTLTTNLRNYGGPGAIVTQI